MWQMLFWLFDFLPFFIQLVCMFLVSARLFLLTESRMELTIIIKQLFLIEVQFFERIGMFCSNAIPDCIREFVKSPYLL